MRTRRQRDARAGVGLLAPALVALAALAAWPGVWVLWLSLQQRIPIFGIDRFVGLAHYGFLAGDARFWNAARVTVVFTLVSVALELALGVAVALLPVLAVVLPLNERAPGRWVLPEPAEP